ncbi:hypothetical protein CVIRNUC_011086 [Coccomyxa viridis]|uniref:Uncharacterized protein n=1 Tax=Coccomyxa viridis TaxID=1274662 RepID=A0AAV1IPE9_9CHLO|nr:hypothetical protein CVIRNUC_011086 [Coccomyxa viridis]
MKSLTSVDRWTAQNASTITVKVSECSIRITQQPRLLDASRAGVGACLWDSAFVLTAFLAAQDQLKWCGAHVIELGAGLGLPGIFLAAQGARVALTDKQSVLPLLQHNVQQNTCSKLNISVEELDWETEDGHQKLKKMGSARADYIIAADCLYIDEGGCTPGIGSFVKACAALCTAPHACCYIAMEKRSASVTTGFFGAAENAGFAVVEVPVNAVMLALKADHIMVLQMHKR